MLRRFSRTATAAAAARFVHLEPTPQAGDKHHACHPQRLRGWDLNQHSFINKVNDAPPTWRNPMEHPVWDSKDVEAVAITHKPAHGAVDKLAYLTVQLLRWTFDLLAGFRTGKITERKYINRCLFLETVAGVPGMVAGMLRHMSSLRRMQRDHGWIHTLLEEAENERMHLLTFMEMRKPGPLFRATILFTQGVFFNGFFLCYLVSPRFCHRLVGYVEEEAVKTYTKILHDIDTDKLPVFKAAKCPPLAVSYWRLPEGATFRDLVAAIRADEAGHRLVNHTFADMHERRMGDSINPFVAYEHK